MSIADGGPVGAVRLAGEVGELDAKARLMIAIEYVGVFYPTVKEELGLAAIDFAKLVDADVHRPGLSIGLGAEEEAYSLAFRVIEGKPACQRASRVLCE